VIIPEVVLIQLYSWWWAHSCSKHVEDSNKRIIEEIVRQVGHLPELYEDARSEKYIIWPYYILQIHCISFLIFYHWKYSGALGQQILS